MELSPGDHSRAGSSELSVQGAWKHVLLAGSANKALSFHSPSPAALMGISLRSLSPSHPAETQGGSADSRQGGQEDASHLEVRQVTHTKTASAQAEKTPHIQYICL